MNPTSTPLLGARLSGTLLRRVGRRVRRPTRRPGQPGQRPQSLHSTFPRIRSGSTFPLCLLLWLGACLSAQAQITAWTGAISTDWATPANWTAGVPDVADNVAILDAALHDPVIGGGTAALARSLTVQSGAKLTLAANASLTINPVNPTLGEELGFYNFGTVENSGQLSLGTTHGNDGLVNKGNFTNHAGGQIGIDRVVQYGLRHYDGTFTNAGILTLGANSFAGEYGLYNTSTFHNQVGGQINIDDTSMDGLRNVADTLTNAGTITIGSDDQVGEYGLYNQATFINVAGGTVHIDHYRDSGLSNVSGTLINEGTFAFGAVPTVGFYGIKNEGIFSNRAGGQIGIDHTSDAGLFNASGVFTNIGTLAIGANAHVGDDGILNEGTFQNNAGGQVSLDRSYTTGVFNTLGTFTNAGILTIGANAHVGTTGIENTSGATFTNQAGGQIGIDRASIAGVFNSFNPFTLTSGTFTNAGILTIGAIGFDGDYGLHNRATFHNSGCSALLHVVANARIQNDAPATLTNSGTMVENASANSNVSNNEGLVFNRQGGTFDVGTGPNQPLAVQTTNSTACPSHPPNGSLKLTGLKANTPYTLSYTRGTTTTPLSPNPTTNASGELTIPGLGAGTYTLNLGGACLPVEIQLTATLTDAPTPPPTVGISGLAAAYCRNAAAVTLTGSPAGGSFTLDGNAATGFDPARVALGPHAVVYSYTDPMTTCSNTASQTVTVNVLPTVSITGLASSFCKNASAVKLAGSPAGGSFTLDGHPATRFDPASLAVGDHPVIYSYTDPATTCANSASQTVTIRQPVFTSPATVSGGPVCAGTQVMLSFAVNCPDNASFSAGLTNAAGMPLGIPLGSVSPGSQWVTIPAGTPTGSYLILVTGSNPTLSSLSGSPFGVTGLASNFNATATVSQVPACAGASIRVSFTQGAAPACSFPPGNVFSAQLSDATGSFAVPVSLGSVSPGLNTLTIPQNTPGGSGYRVRIAATTNGSAAYSAPSAAFTVNAPGFSSTPTVSADNKCAGEAVRVSFSVNGCAFPVGNGFTAQLSNAAGSFANPVNVGSVSPGALNNVVIPAGTPAGTGYKIRIVSSNPVVTSAVSGNFKVKACGNNREVAPEETGLQVRVSPNPSPEGRLRISVSGAEGQTLKVELFNGVGQLVRDQNQPNAAAEEVLDWDMSRQPGGLYLLRVSGETKSKTLKVLH